MAIVGVDSDDEEVTLVCREYRDERVYPLLSDQGMTLQIFSGVQATRTLVSPVLQRPQTKFLSASGHGFATRFTGQQRRSILEIGHYDPVDVRNKIIHLLSCETGAGLGADMVQNGCRAFFGYDVEFVFPLAEPDVFLDCDAVIDTSLAAGLTAEEAYFETIAAFDRQVAALKRAGKIFLASLLEVTRDHLCAPTVDRKWGDPAARI